MNELATNPGFNPLTGLFVCNAKGAGGAGAYRPEGFNPLTGLFVCNTAFLKPWRELIIKFQSPYGAFCLQLSECECSLLLSPERFQSPYGAFCLQPIPFPNMMVNMYYRCFNPLTGLFVCNWRMGRYHLDDSVGSFNPLTGLFVCNFSM